VTVTLHLPPDIEHALLAEAEARGLSLDVLLEILLRQFTTAARPDEPTTEGTIIQLDDGMLALHSGHPISAETVNDTIDALRRERDLNNLGTFR